MRKSIWPTIKLTSYCSTWGSPTPTDSKQLGAPAKRRLAPPLKITALCCRPKKHGRGVVRRAGTRASYPQLHRRRRGLHRHLWKYQLSKSCCGKNDGLVLERG